MNYQTIWSFLPLIIIIEVMEDVLMVGEIGGIRFINVATKASTDLTKKVISKICISYSTVIMFFGDMQNL